MMYAQNGVVQITDIINLISSSQFDDHVYPIQTHD